jgi:arylsulfatase A-like enzyme
MSQRQPNVIVFFTDQQRWDSTGLHGNPLDLTPNFDAAARRGTHVQHNFTCQPVCGPARSCMLTGQYPTTTGSYRNGRIPPLGTPMLGHYFAETGYATGYIGKWHLGPPEIEGPVAPEYRGGYEYWLAANVLEMTSDAYRCDVFDGGGNKVRLPGYRVDALTDAAIGFIDRNQHRPFHLFLSFLEPHHQNHLDNYPAPEGYEQRYQGRWSPPDLAALGNSSAQQLGGYWGMVKRLDEAFGRLLDALRSLGLYENTVVLFTADHGNHFKTRNGEYKRSCHESSIRTPAMLCGGPFEGGGQIRQLVSLIDMPPTLLDAAGITPPPVMQGRSILPLLRDRRSPWPDDVLVQISESEVGRALRTGRWKYGVVAPDKNGWNDSASDRFVESHLYDLHADPYELSNLAGFESHRAVADRLRQRLIHRMILAGESAPVIDPAPPLASGQRRVAHEEIGQ